MADTGTGNGLCGGTGSGTLEDCKNCLTYSVEWCDCRRQDPEMSLDEQCQCTAGARFSPDYCICLGYSRGSTEYCDCIGTVLSEGRNLEEYCRDCKGTPDTVYCIDDDTCYSRADHCSSCLHGEYCVEDELCYTSDKEYCEKCGEGFYCEDRNECYSSKEDYCAECTSTDCDCLTGIEKCECMYDNPDKYPEYRGYADNCVSAESYGEIVYDEDTDECRCRCMGPAAERGFRIPDATGACHCHDEEGRCVADEKHVFIDTVERCDCECKDNPYPDYPLTRLCEESPSYGYYDNGTCSCICGSDRIEVDGKCVCRRTDCGPCGMLNAETCECEWDDSACPESSFGCGEKYCDYDTGCRIDCSPCALGPCDEEPTGGGAYGCYPSCSELREKCVSTGGIEHDCACDCGAKKEWKDCDTGCACIDDYSYECNTSGGEWDSNTCECTCPSSKEFDEDTHTCVCKSGAVGSQCFVPDGDCKDRVGVIQEDCSCVISCPGGGVPGDDCVTAAGVGAEGAKLTCECACGCENTGACTVAVDDCPAVPGTVNPVNCKCDADCKPFSDTCDYTDSEGCVGEGEKDCECNCTCKSKGDCVYDKTRPGIWTDECKCTCNDVTAECVFTDINENKGAGTVGEDCDCHCIVGGGCTYSYDKSHTSVGVFNDSCVCECADFGKETCLQTGEGWDHKRCVCGCNGDARSSCTGTGHVWTEENCTCDCVEPDLQKKCTDSGGTWDTEYCACMCPSYKTAVDGECLCGASKEEAEKKQDACVKAGGEAYDYDKCECDCPSDKEWDDKSATCRCADFEREMKKCNDSGFLYDRNKCECSKCSINSSLREFTLCADSVSNVGFDFDTCTCKCKDIHQTRVINRQGALECRCDDSYYGKLKKDCKTPAKRDAGWAWVESNCNCECKNWKDRRCTVGDYSNATRDSHCNCPCPASVIGTSCGEDTGLWYDSSCNCNCTEGDSCTIEQKNDGTQQKDEHGKCYCRCLGGGRPCSIVDKHTQTEITGLETGPDCHCRCGDMIGTPCEWIEGDPYSGKLWDDCQCKCSVYKQFCTTDTVLYGQYDDNCECTCAPNGTICMDPDGRIGKVINGENGLCDCVCDDIKEQEDCVKKQTADPVRRDGSPKPWQFSHASCDCVCADANYDCWYTNDDGELVPGKINADTCECEDCNLTAVSCQAVATPNMDDCKCECTGEDVPICMPGETNIAALGCKCGCPEDVYEEDYCASKPHQGDESDVLVLGEHCDCVCNNAGAECPLETGGKGRKQASDCKCKCDLTEETAGCNDSQRFDHDLCKCVCLDDLPDCVDGDKTWTPTEATKCLCVCDDVHPCKNSGEWLDYSEDGSGCKCDCTDAKLPAGHQWSDSEHVKFSEYDCSEYCAMSAADCSPSFTYDSAYCDCGKCERLRKSCSGTTPDFYQDDRGCGCFCDEKSRRPITCREWDPLSCSCKKECPDFDPAEEQRRVCEVFDSDSCDYKPDKSALWYQAREAMQWTIADAIRSMTHFRGSSIPAEAPDVVVCRCAEYEYSSRGGKKGDCDGKTLDTYIREQKYARKQLKDTVSATYKKYTDCIAQMKGASTANSLKECGSALAYPSCEPSQAEMAQYLKDREALNAIDTEIKNLAASVSAQCDGTPCAACDKSQSDPGGGSGDDSGDPEVLICGARQGGYVVDCVDFDEDEQECQPCLEEACSVYADVGIEAYCTCVFVYGSAEYAACVLSAGA